MYFSLRPTGKGDLVLLVEADKDLIQLQLDDQYIESMDKTS